MNFRPRRKNLTFSRGPALVFCCLAGLAAPASAWAQAEPLRPTKPAADFPSDIPLDQPGAAAAQPGGASSSDELPSGSSGLPPVPARGAPNYGKPKILVPGQKKPKKTPAHPLPPLVPYPTSAEARRNARALAKSGEPVDAGDLVPPPAPSPTTAMPQPLPQHARPRVDDDPFAPVGIDAGLLRVKPFAETDFGYSDNPNQASKGSPLLRGSSFLHSEAGLSGQSDWSSHSFVGDLRLGYDDYLADHSADAPVGSGKFTARVDVTRDTKINIDGKFDLSTQNPTSPNLAAVGPAVTLKSRPIIADGGLGLGATQDFNRLELTLRGGFERVYWQNAQFSDGSTQQLSEESYDAYGLTARAAYELTPGLKPFVEGTVDRRDHDSLVDISGYMRDSTGDALRAGSTMEMTGFLTGDVSAGYADRHYQDKRLRDLRGPTFDSSLVWTATPLTKVTLRGSTTMDETTIAGSPGALTRQGGIEVSHALLRNLTLTANGSVSRSDYADSGISQTLLQTGLQVAYNMTRTIVIKGSFTHQRMLSNTPGTDYTANIIMLGLRIQQ